MAFKLGSSIVKKNLKVYFDPGNPQSILPSQASAFPIPSEYNAVIADNMSGPAGSANPHWDTPPVVNNLVNGYLHAIPFHISQYHDDGYHANPHHRQLKGASCLNFNSYTAPNGSYSNYGLNLGGNLHICGGGDEQTSEDNGFTITFWVFSNGARPNGQMVINELYTYPTNATPVLKSTGYKSLNDQVASASMGGMNSNYNSGFAGYIGDANSGYNDMSQDKELEARGQANLSVGNSNNNNNAAYFMGTSNGVTNRSADYFGWDFTKNGNDQINCNEEQFAGVAYVDMEIEAIQARKYGNANSGLQHNCNLQCQLFTSQFNSYLMHYEYGNHNYDFTNDTTNQPFTGYLDDSNQASSNNHTTYYTDGNHGNFSFGDCIGEISSYYWYFRTPPPNSANIAGEMAGTLRNQSNNNLNTYAAGNTAGNNYWANIKLHDPFRAYRTPNHTNRGTGTSPGTSGGSPAGVQAGTDRALWGIGGLQGQDQQTLNKIKQGLGVHFKWEGVGLNNQMRLYIDTFRLKVDWYEHGDLDSGTVDDSDGWYVGGLANEPNDLVFGVIDKPSGKYNSVRLENFWEDRNGQWTCVTVKYSPDEGQILIKNHNTGEQDTDKSSNTPNAIRWTNGNRNCVIGAVSQRKYSYESSCPFGGALGQMWIYDTDLDGDDVGGPAMEQQYLQSKWRYS